MVWRVGGGACGAESAALPPSVANITDILLLLTDRFGYERVWNEDPRVLDD